MAYDFFSGPIPNWADSDSENSSCLSDVSLAEADDISVESDLDSENMGEVDAISRLQALWEEDEPSDCYGNILEDIFFTDYRERWMCVHMNSPVLMTKGVVEEGEVFYELDTRYMDMTSLEDMLSRTKLNVEIHGLFTTIANFDTSMKGPYTSKMQVCKADSLREFAVSMRAILVPEEAPKTRELTSENLSSKHMEAVMSSSKETTIVRVNFFPNEEDLANLASKGVLAVVPGSKLMCGFNAPKTLDVASSYRPTDKRISLREKDPLAFDTRSVYLHQYSFVDSEKKKFHHVETTAVSPKSLIKMFRKASRRSITVSSQETMTIESSVMDMEEPALSMEWIAKYLKVRSFMMEKVMADHLDLVWMDENGQPTEWEGEKKISELYPELKGLDMLTPDLAVCSKTCRDLRKTLAMMKVLTDSEVDENTIYFVDIKVSDKGSKLAVNETTSKYAAFCAAINARFEKEGSKMRSSPKVISFNLTNVQDAQDMMSMCKLMGTEVEERYNAIRNHWEKKLRDDRDYRNMKSAYESTEQEKFDKISFDALFGTYLMKNPDSMFKDSFSTEFVGLEGSSEAKSIIDFSMTEEECSERLIEYTKAILDSYLAVEEKEGKQVPKSKIFTEVAGRYTEKADLTSMVNKRQETLENRVKEGPYTVPIADSKAFKVPFLADNENILDVREMETIFGQRNTKMSKDGTLIVHSKVIEGADLMNSHWYPNHKPSSNTYEAMKLGHNFSRQVAKSLESEMGEISMTVSTSAKLSRLYEETVENVTWTDMMRTKVKAFVMTKQFENLMNLQKLMEEIVQIEGRRSGYLKKEFHNYSSKKHCVFRSFGPYILEVKGGTKLTRNSKLRFRVWTSKSTEAEMNTKEFHKFYQVPGTLLVATKYLSIQPIDLVTYLNIFESAMMLTVGFVEKFLESNPGMVPSDNHLMSLTVRLFQLMEHRNSTSVASQLSRYLLVGGTSLYADRAALIAEIGEDVIRSKFQMFTIWKQLEWTKEMSKLRPMFLTDAIARQANGSNSKPMELPSFYADTMFSLAMLLDEIYFCNLLDPNYGTRKHMTESTFKKMAKMEILWREKIGVREKLEYMRGLVKQESWDLDEDSIFFFDRTIVYASMKQLMGTVSMDQVMRSFLVKTFEPLSELMTLKSSVMETFGTTVYDDKRSMKEVRSTAFETQKSIMDRYQLKTVLDVANTFNHFDYYFAEFPKPQIGGPREILIQDIYTRAKARMLENFFNVLNKHFENEMTSNSQLKYTRQANMDFNLRKSAEQQKDVDGVTFNLANNKDHSKWSPGANILQYTYMVTPMDIGKKLKAFLITALLAYATAVIGLPREMASTASNLGLTTIRKTKEKEVVWMYNEFYKNNPGSKTGVVVMKSGWPQGMLQFTSSTYHVVEKAAMKAVWSWLAQSFGANWNIFDMITSDDTTDYMLVQMRGLGHMSSFLANMIASGYSVGQAFNMHENKKKSNLQLVIKEFNSIFQVGKSVMTALVKFLVKAVAVPDFTYPEEAAKELISQEQMLLANGATVSILNACRACHRRMLRTGYNQESYTKDICDVLECKEEDLPLELGYLPKDLVMESCVFGSAIYNFVEKPPKVKEFMEKLYSTRRANMNFFSVDKTSYMADMAFKEKLKLPMKLDTKMREMKARIGVTDGFMTEIAEKRFDVMMEGPESVFSSTYACYKMMSINVRFSIDTGFLYRTHSMIRANQINSENGLLSNTSEKPVKTIKDFVAMIMENTDYLRGCLDNHPMKDIMTLAVSINKEVCEKLRSNSIGTTTRPKDPKFRQVCFCNKEMYPTMSPRDAYRMYMMRPSKRSKREKYKAETLSKFYQLSGEFTSKSLVSVLSEKDNLNAMTLSSIFENMAAMMKDYTMTIPFEDMPSQNAAKNMQSLLRNRMYADKVLMEFDLDAEVVIDTLEMSDVGNNVTTMGLLATNISEISMLAKAFKRDNLIREIDAIRPDQTNLERLVTTVNYLADNTGKEVFMSDLMMEMKMTTFFSAKSIGPNIVGDKPAMVHTWVREGFQAMSIWTKDQYFLIFYNPEEDQAAEDDIITSERTRYMRKDHMDLSAYFSKKDSCELGDITLVWSEDPLLDMGVKIRMDMGKRLNHWSVETCAAKVPTMDRMGDFTFKVFSSRMATELPLLSDEAMNLVTDAGMKAKLRVIQSVGRDIADMDIHEIRNVASLWMTEEESYEIPQMFYTEEEEEMEVQMLLDTRDGRVLMNMRDAIMPGLRSGMSSLNIMSSELVEDDDRAVTAEMQMGMMNMFGTGEPESVMEVMLAMDGGFGLEEEEEAVEDVNGDMAKRRAVSSVAMKVRRFLVNELGINIGSVRSLVNGSTSFSRKYNVAVDMGKVYHDILESLLERIHMMLSDGKRRERDLDRESSVFLMCSKVLLSCVFDKETKFTVKTRAARERRVVTF